MRVLVVAVCVLAACGKKAEDKPPPAQAPAPAPGAFDQLTVTVLGKRVPIDRAFIKRISPGAYVVQVGHLQGSCEELLTSVADAKPGGTSFSLTIARQLAPSGHDKLVVTDFWSRSLPTEPALGGTAKLSGEPEPGTTITVELPRLIDVEPPRTDAKVLVTGTFPAIGCGENVVTGMGMPKAPHPSKATLTIAGKQLPIQGVILNPPDIVISTGPKDCSPVTLAAPVILERIQGKWGLRGTWLARPVQNTALPDEATEALQFAARGVGKSEDGPVIELELSGSGKVGDYPIKLDGIVEAIECVGGR